MGLPALPTRTRFLLRTPLLLGLLLGLSLFAAGQVAQRSGLEAAPVRTGSVIDSFVTSATLGGDGSPGNPYILAANSTVTVLIDTDVPQWKSTLVPGAGCVTHGAQFLRNFDVTAAGPGTSGATFFFGLFTEITCGGTVQGTVTVYYNTPAPPPPPPPPPGELIVTKAVGGGPAQPSDFGFSVTSGGAPLVTFAEQFPGADGTTTFSIAFNATVSVEESTTHPDYVVDDSDCATVVVGLGWA